MEAKAHRKKFVPSDFKRLMNGMLFRGNNGAVATICLSLIGKDGKAQDALAHFFLAAALGNIGCKREATAHLSKAIALDPSLANEKASPKSREWELSHKPKPEDPMPELGEFF